MSGLKSKVGTTSGLFRDEVTLEQIAAFCRAIGREENHVAPPIFLTVLRRGEFTLFQRLGCELSNVLHAGQEYHYENSIRAGDVVCFETVLANVLEKKKDSTLMQFMTFETDFTAERNSEKIRIGRAKTTVVVREAL